MKTLLTVNQSDGEIEWEFNTELSQLECVALLGLLKIFENKLLDSLYEGDEAL